MYRITIQLNSALRGEGHLSGICCKNEQWKFLVILKAGPSHERSDFIPHFILMTSYDGTTSLQPKKNFDEGPICTSPGWFSV